MPYLERETAKLFYDDVGEGPLILTTHGVCENGSYWGRTGDEILSFLAGVSGSAVRYTAW